MANYNKVILIGNLTRDPEVRFLAKGTAVAKLSIAVNRNWKAENGEQREEVTYVDVDAFGKQAELIGQYLRKGRPIMVEGRLRLDSWEDKQTGQKRSKLGVVLEQFQFIDSAAGRSGSEGEGAAGGGREGAGTAGARQRAAAPASPAAEGNSDEGGGEPPTDDDVPF